MQLALQAPVDVIIPVYQDLAVTHRCLDSVLGHRQQRPHEVIVIDDASPDSDLVRYLDDLAAAGRITLLHNPVNQGFVATANRGLALHPDRDVVLLNSDTEVTSDWLDRLARCAYAGVTTGTVTPFSNNATLCSYPHPSAANELPPGLSLAETDALFQRANAGRWLEIPTAVGFCMYIRRDCLQAVGAFDEHNFGLGYGEENDFCMRAAKAGWRHALCADTYVYHVGGVSFGERQTALQEQARAALTALHPDYDDRIQAFVRADPARPLRVAVDWERALLGPEQALYVLRERDETLARLWREREEILTREQRTTVTLEQGLRNVESLLVEARDEARQRDQALAEAQRYVREREADVVLLTDQLQAAQDNLTDTMRQIETLSEQNRDLMAHMEAIHASRVWRYTEFLRKYEASQKTMNPTAHLFTSITANYLPKARVLAQSARRQAADIRFHLLLCDDYPADADPAAEPFDSIINVTELPIPEREAWLFGHTVVEMCTAVKALGFLEITRRHQAEKMFYFDPDMVILSGLDDLMAQLDRHSLLLTPHVTEPEQTLDAIMDNEIASLKHGVFNLGFLGVRTSAEGMRFLNWWAERLRYFCHDDIAGGLFTDQRWIDLAPAFFEDIAILREPIYNVATWNLTHRPVAGSLEQGLTIYGQPLSFYHFSGFDGGAQEVMLNKYANAGSALFDLRRWYLTECQSMGQNELGDRRCRYDTFDNGERITRAQRLLYRSRLDLRRAFPDPFCTEGHSYYHWYRMNAAGADAETLETEMTLRAQLVDARRELDLIQRSRSWRLAQVFARLFNVFRQRR